MFGPHDFKFPVQIILMFFKAISFTFPPPPHLYKLQRTKDCFLVLTTDGVSAIMDAQEVCDIVKKCQDPSEAATVVNEQARQEFTENLRSA